MSFNDRAIAAAEAASQPVSSATQPVPAPPAESAAAKQARVEFEKSCRIAFRDWCHKVGLEPGDLEGDLAISASYIAEHTFPASRTSHGGPFSMGTWSTSSPGGHHPGGHDGTLKFRIAGHEYVGTFRDYSVVFDGQSRALYGRLTMWILIRRNPTDTQGAHYRADTREDIGEALIVEERWFRAEREST
jgi:hypothetical protein